mgnify:CR=1 FL=1
MPRLISHRHITGRSVLVTGAGGSIGSALCERILALRPARLLLFSLTEGALVALERRLRASVNASETELVCVLGSVTNAALLARWVPAGGIVIHCAAHKHVPVCEQNPSEAVLNNVGGTLAVCRAAKHAGALRTLLVSTDKAVQPASIMGATKAVAERIVSDFGPGFLAVRFGNVLDSAGSVLPLWREQIAHGGPVTVTDARCERYFMAISDACTLILETLALDVDQGTYVFDMGSPRNLLAMAEALIAESNQPCLIAMTGLRPGDKLTEELTEGERTPTTHPQVFAVTPAPPLAQDDVRLLRLLGTAQTVADELVRPLLTQAVTAGARAPRIVTAWKPSVEPVTFVTWKWLGPDVRRQFASEHVNVLAAMLARHYHAPHRLVCITDDPVGLDGSIDVCAMPETKADGLGAPRIGDGKLFPACYRRLWLFSDAARDLGTRLVQLDIDVVILEDITALIQSKTASFVGWSTGEFGWSKIAGGLWALTPGTHSDVWDDFDVATSPGFAAASGNNGSDQAWLSYKLFPPRQAWTAKDGVIKISWLEKAGRHPKPGIKLVFTIGLQPPWSYEMQIGHPWLREHWRL